MCDESIPQSNRQEQPDVGCHFVPTKIDGIMETILAVETDPVRVIQARGLAQGLYPTAAGASCETSVALDLWLRERHINLEE
jgi:hypothetical protein